MCILSALWCILPGLLAIVFLGTMIGVLILCAWADNEEYLSHPTGYMEDGTYLRNGSF